MLTLLFFFFSWSSYFHDVSVAFFDLKVSEDGIELEMKFIKENMEKVLKESYPNTDFSNKLNKHKIIETSLSTHLRWIINGSAKNCVIDQISEDEHYIFITALFSKPQHSIQRIEIYNTCLIEQIHEHSNIMSFHIHNKERMFRLHRKRVRILVEYS